MTIRTRTESVRPDGAELAAIVGRMLRTEVLVGIPDDGPARRTEDGKPAPSNALIGYVQEYGSSSRNIPPRPFLAPGVASVSGQLATMLTAVAQAGVRGDAVGVRQGFDNIGATVQIAVRRKITDGPFVPLKLATIRGRARAGQGAAKTYLRLRGEGTPTDVLDEAGVVTPLVFTGQLRQAVTYVVLDGGAEK